MNLISRQELKEKLDHKDDFKLVMVLGEWHYRAAHIPSSIHIGGPDDAAKLLELNDEIVVYCSNEACLASRIAYERLVAPRIHQRASIRSGHIGLDGGRLSTRGRSGQLRLGGALPNR